MVNDLFIVADDDQCYGWYDDSFHYARRQQCGDRLNRRRWRLIRKNPHFYSWRSWNLHFLEICVILLRVLRRLNVGKKNKEKDEVFFMGFRWIFKRRRTNKSKGNWGSQSKLQSKNRGKEEDKICIWAVEDFWDFSV